MKKKMMALLLGVVFFGVNVWGAAMSEDYTEGTLMRSIPQSSPEREQSPSSTALVLHSDEFSKLPPELVQEVLRFLDIPQLLKASTVCKAWLSAASDPHLCKYLWNKASTSLSFKYLLKFEYGPWGQALQFRAIRERFSAEISSLPDYNIKIDLNEYLKPLEISYDSFLPLKILNYSAKEGKDK